MLLLKITSLVLSAFVLRALAMGSVGYLGPTVAVTLNILVVLS